MLSACVSSDEWKVSTQENNAVTENNLQVNKNAVMAMIDSNFFVETNQ